VALVYYEHTTNVFEAISREKEIKKWRREKKNKLVGSMNPEWKDLSKDWGLDFSLPARCTYNVLWQAGVRNDVYPSCHFEGSYD